MRSVATLLGLLSVGCAAGRRDVPAAAIVRPASTATYVVQVDRQAAAEAGIPTADIANAVAKAQAIRPVAPAKLDDVRAIIVATVDGKRVHLGDVAAVTIGTVVAPPGHN